MAGSREARFDNPSGSGNPPAAPPAFLSAAEAIALLGVKRATLYSYASRGWVRSLPSPAGGHLYAREDLDRLRQRHDARAGHGPVAAAALAYGEPVLQTALCRIGPQGPLYRGREAILLARGEVSFEAVCEWLWWGTDGPMSAWPAPDLPALASLKLDRSTSPIGAMLSVAAMHAAAPPSSPENPRAAVRLLAVAAGLPFGPVRHKRAASVAATLAAALRCKGPKPAMVLEDALILCAEHELTASTFATRVAASAGAGLWACLSAGLAVLSGPRHGASSELVSAYVDAIRSPGAATKAAADTLRRHEAIPGFGHPLYPAGDPRGTAMLELARATNRPATRTFEALASAVSAATGEHPTLDLGLAALAAALDLPPSAGTAIFALGRTAGLVAHVIEQRSDGRLLRPRARYVGN